MTTTDSVASSLADLMTRLERKRRSFQTQQDYVRLIFIGLLFILAGMLLNGTIHYPFIIVFTLVGSPYMLGFYTLTRFRLNEEFQRQTLPYYWSQVEGDWNFVLHAAKFPLNEFRQLEFVVGNPNVSNVARGTINGVPVLFAEVATYRIRAKRQPGFTGYTMRLTPPDVAATVAKLEAMNIGKVKTQGEHVWLLCEAEASRFGAITLKSRMNEPETYERAENAVAAMAQLAREATAPDVALTTAQA